jgi:hypothetical protein
MPVDLSVGYVVSFNRISCTNLEGSQKMEETNAEVIPQKELLFPIAEAVAEALSQLHQPVEVKTWAWFIMHAQLLTTDYTKLISSWVLCMERLHIGLGYLGVLEYLQDLQDKAVAAITADRDGLNFNQDTEKVTKARPALVAKPSISGSSSIDYEIRVDELR